MITKAKIQSGRLMCTVAWEKRPNGVQPDETVIANTEVKKYHPLLLCEFYEKICKVKKKPDPKEAEVKSPKGGAKGGPKCEL